VKRDSVLIVVSYFLVYIVWGSTYFFIRAAAQTLAPSLILAGRFLTGAILLTAMAWAKGALKQLPSLKEAAGSALLGVLLLLIANGLLTIAEKTIPSYVASLIGVCAPFLIAFFNFLFYRERISVIRIIGVLVGVIGIAVLLYDGTSLAGSLSLGVLLAFAGSIFWSLGTSGARALPKAKDVVVSTAIQMYVTGIVALVSAAVTLPDLGAAIRGGSAWSWFGVANLAVLSTLAFLAYNHLLVKEPTFRVSSYVFVNPLVAVTLGLATGEKATPYLLLAVPVVLVGIAFMVYGDVIRGKLKAKRTV
jgi:drug/metabolite transporter (DMT)-like permease